MLNSTYFSGEGIAAKAEKGILQELGQALGSITQRAEEPESRSSQSRGGADQRLLHSPTFTTAASWVSLKFQNGQRLDRVPAALH